MKYPITPEYLAAAPGQLVELYRDFESWVLIDIALRIKRSQELPGTALEQLRLLKRMGYDEKDLMRQVKKLSGLSDKEFKKAYANAVERNMKFSQDILKEAYNPALMTMTTAAIEQQTAKELKNITRSMGFALRVGNTVRVTSIGEAYERILDNAIMRIDLGAQDYNSAIISSVKQLTNSGLQYVDYDSGWHNRVDVAVRRALNTGISQLSAKYTEQNMKELETDLVEVTAHRGARDVDGPKGWENHAAWQGKVYSMNRGSKYPNLHDTCGYGEIDGLAGINCRHHFYPFIEGLSKRTYTDEQLEKLRSSSLTIDGKQYTIYEATQMQRSLESSIRRCRRELIMYDALDQKEKYTDTAVRYRRLIEKYKEVTEKAGLTNQLDERTLVNGFGPEQFERMMRAGND